MLRTILILASVFAVAGSALADQISFNNGDRLSGTIVRLDGDSLEMKSEVAGDIKVPWKTIVQVSSSQPLYVTLNDDQVVVGVVSTSGDRMEIETKETGKVTVSREAIRSIRSQQEQAAYQAQIDRLRNPKLSDFWSGFADAGLSLTKGNSDTTTFNVGMKAARTTSRDKISVYFTSLYAKNNAVGRSITTADTIFGGTRYDFNVTDRLFAFGLTDLEYNKLQNLDLRLVLGGGLGLHAKKTERTLLDVFAGASYNQEFFSTDLTRRSAEILLGEELSHKVSGATTISERFVLYPNLSETGEYRFTFDSSAATKLREWLAWQVSFSDRFISNPIPGIKKNDVLLTTGIRLTFGGKKL
ncbi:MAG TPA: DUF481 domain-containing protein [Acidobacteriota bacterium]